jgi:hypothetical protein
MFLPTSADATIVPKGIDKGSGLVWTKKYLNCESEPVAAVGDNDQDLDMLRGADLAFAPANCSQSVRALAASRGCKLTRQSFQKGLLEAVMQVIHAGDQQCDKCDVQLLQAEGCGALFQSLMEIAERPTFLRFSSISNRPRP